MSSPNITPALDQAEELARFLLSRNWFAPSKSQVRPGAFSPPQDFRLSTFRKRGFSPAQLVDLGRDIARDRDRTYYGDAEIIVSDVEAVGLQVDPDNNPIAWHASIIDWPSDKDAELEYKIELARRARLVLV